MRELEASTASALNCSAHSGKKWPKTSDAAPEKHECPEIYAGKFGTCSAGLIVGSICEGRASQYLYFTRQHTTPASNIDTLSAHNTCDASDSECLALAMCSQATSFQSPAGVDVPTAPDHRLISSCSDAVALAVRSLTSCSASKNSWLDTWGGGWDKYSSGEPINIGLTFPHCGRIGGRFSNVFHSPTPCGGTPCVDASALSPTRLAITSFAMLLPISHAC